MKLRIWIRIFCTSVVVLTIAGSLGYISVSHLKRNAQSIVHDTLPGLSFAGEANAYLADASRTLLVIVTEDETQRLAIRKEIDTLSDRTTGYLDRYGESVYDQEDKANFEKLLAERNAYIKIRNDVLDLALRGSKAEALALYNSTMVPAHKRVKAAGDHLFEYNMKQGEVRGRNILAICNTTQITVAILSVVIFVAGFFIGLFK